MTNWLDDIVAWGDKMASYLDGLTEAEFLCDPMRQDAVVRCLECIGEASRQVVAASPDGLPDDLEFAQAYWARNRFVHGYYDLDMGRVWLTATVSAPQLVAGVKRLVGNLG